MDTGMEMQNILLFDMPNIGTTYSKYNRTNTLEKLGKLTAIRYINKNEEEEEEKPDTIQNVELSFDNKEGPINVVKYRNNKISQKLVNSGGSKKKKFSKNAKKKFSKKSKKKELRGQKLQIKKRKYLP